jgi:hypothetical protein
MSTDDFSGYNIDKIKITHYRNQYAKWSGTVSVGSTVVKEIAESDIGTSSSSPNVLEIDNISASGTITIDLKNSVTATGKNQNGNYEFCGIEITFSEIQSSKTPLTTFAFEKETDEAIFGQDYTLPGLNIEPSDADASLVTYSSSNPEVATVGESTGAVTLLKSGTTTITAKYAGNDTYQSAETSYELTVKDERTSATLAFPEESYTVEATAWADFVAPTVTATPSDITDIVYSSSNPAVATVDESTGAVTIVKSGTTVITATYVGNDKYTSASASYTLRVKGTMVALIAKEAKYEGDGESIVAPTVTSGKMTATLTGVATVAIASAYNNDDYIRWYAGSNSMTITPVAGIIITKVKFLCGDGKFGKITLGGTDITTSSTSPTAEFADLNYDAAFTVSNNNTQIRFAYMEISYKPDTRVKAVTFDPASGSKIDIGSTVSLTSATEGATISYRFGDDGDWTEGAEVVVNTGGSVTIEAKATKEGMDDSDVTSATYTVETYERESVVAFLSEKDTKNAYTITGPMLITMINGRDMLVVDAQATDAVTPLLVNGGDKDAFAGYAVGQAITGLKGTYNNSAGTIRMNDVGLSGVKTAEGDYSIAANAIESLADMSQHATHGEVLTLGFPVKVLAETSSNHFTVTDQSDNTYALWNRYNSATNYTNVVAKPETGKWYDITSAISWVYTTEGATAELVPLDMTVNEEMNSALGKVVVTNLTSGEVVTTDAVTVAAGTQLRFHADNATAIVNDENNKTLAIGSDYVLTLTKDVAIGVYAIKGDEDITDAVTLYVTVTDADASAVGNWVEVTSIRDIAEGDVVAIAAKSASTGQYYAMGSEATSSRMTAVDATVDGSSLAVTTDMGRFTVTDIQDNTFALKLGDAYLSKSSLSSAELGLYDDYDATESRFKLDSEFADLESTDGGEYCYIGMNYTTDYYFGAWKQTTLDQTNANAGYAYLYKKVGEDAPIEALVKLAGADGAAATTLKAADDGLDDFEVTLADADNGFYVNGVRYEVALADGETLATDKAYDTFVQSANTTTDSGATAPAVALVKMDGAEPLVAVYLAEKPLTLLVNDADNTAKITVTTVDVPATEPAALLGSRDDAPVYFDRANAYAITVKAATAADASATSYTANGNLKQYIAFGNGDKEELAAGDENTVVGIANSADYSVAISSVYSIDEIYNFNIGENKATVVPETDFAPQTSLNMEVYSDIKPILMPYERDGAKVYDVVIPFTVTWNDAEVDMSGHAAYLGLSVNVAGREDNACAAGHKLTDTTDAYSGRVFGDDADILNAAPDQATALQMVDKDGNRCYYTYNEGDTWTSARHNWAANAVTAQFVPIRIDHVTCTDLDATADAVKAALDAATVSVQYELTYVTATAKTEPAAASIRRRASAATAFDYTVQTSASGQTADVKLSDIVSVNDIVTGIAAISADKLGEAVYYNLQGIRVDGENLTPGFYIVRSGNTATKVYIR